MDESPETVLKRIKSTRSSKSPPKSKSRSPDKVSKSAKSANDRKSSKSKSPAKRKSAASTSEARDKENLFDQSSLNMKLPPKSTPELEDLSLQGLTILNTKIFQKITLRKLILSGNNLRSLPSAIADLVNLEHLDLSKNPLKVKDVDDSNCLPFEMRLMKNLKFLSLRECNLRHIPTTVWLCVSLKKLDISRNKIGLLVPDVGNLQNLEFINLSQCNLSTLPNEISFCGELTDIILMANNIESLPETLKHLRKLKNLKMSYRGFSSLLDSYMEQLISKGQIKSEHIPMVIFELESLTALDLKHTKINNMAENSFKSLEELYLDNNFFSNLNEFNSSTNSNVKDTLTTLTISNNLLKQIPDELNELVNLQILNLSNNFIREANTRLNMKNLKELYLNNNFIHSIGDDCFRDTKQLLKLTLDKNELAHFSNEHSLFGLDQLAYLDLSYNKLTQIPTSIVGLKSLRIAHSYSKMDKIGLWIIGNPLKIPGKDVWQTVSIDKIYDYLSNYEQRNLDHVFYANVFVMTATDDALAKVNLVNFLFNPNAPFDSSNNHSSIRRFYTRTVNKVEWSILDTGDFDSNKSLHSLFFSSIDYQLEPTVFLIIYNHSAYTSDSHHRCLEPLLETILFNVHSDETSISTINIQLLGYVHDGANDHDPKQDIIDNCTKTFERYFATLGEQLENVNRQIETQTDDENRVYLERAKKRLESLMYKRIQLNDEILIVKETELNKRTVENVYRTLESHTIRLGKTAPLEMRTLLRDHLLKIRSNDCKKTHMHEFMASLDQNEQITNLLGECNWTKTDLLNYAKTINEIVWLKFDQRLDKFVYLNYVYVLNVIRLFFHAGIKKELEKSIDLESSIGFFKNMTELKQTLSLFKKYGLVEHKLIKQIYFNDKFFINAIEKLDLNSIIDESLTLLQEFYLIYKIDAHDFEEPQSSYFKVSIPCLCATSYENEKSKVKPDSWNSCLFTDDYEAYFVRLDLIRQFNQETKLLNAFRKERMLWRSKSASAKESEFNYAIYNFDNRENSQGVKEIYEQQTGYFGDTSPFEQNDDYGDEIDEGLFIKTKIYDSTGELKFAAASLMAVDYKHKLELSVRSPFRIHQCVFDKISVLVQDLCVERFDWKDVIIGRDLNGTCYKARFLNSNQISIELKATQADYLNEIKEKMLDITQVISSLYPGLFYMSNVKVYDTSKIQ